MSDLRVIQKGNRLSFNFAGNEIWIEVEGIELPPVNDHSFALWMALPLAMQKRIPLHVHGPVDGVVVENATGDSPGQDGSESMRRRARGTTGDRPAS